MYGIPGIRTWSHRMEGPDESSRFKFKWSSVENIFCQLQTTIMLVGAAQWLVGFPH